MRGVTLVELMVVLAVLGVVAGISGLAMASLRPPVETELSGVLQRARGTAVRQGRTVTVVREDGTKVLFLPDGRVIGSGVDPWSGQVSDAGR
jgi:prepilin-type N-terminal cleavage/methylation domain-containing protein